MRDNPHLVGFAGRLTIVLLVVLLGFDAGPSTR